MDTLEWISLMDTLKNYVKSQTIDFLAMSGAVYVHHKRNLFTSQSRIKEPFTHLLSSLSLLPSHKTPFSLCYTSLLLPLCGCVCVCAQLIVKRAWMNHRTHSQCLKIVNSCATSTHIHELCQLLLLHKRI
ncbi:hypothetical protein AMTRI_Chr12g236060 [Amborella trichopoda]